MIGEQTVNSIGEALTSNLLDRLPTLQEEYGKAEEDGGKFTINAKIAIELCPEGNQVDIESSFKVVDRTRRIVNENQMSFLEGDNGGSE